MQKSFFAKASREEIITAVSKEGFSPKLIHDEANFVYEQHQHKETKLLVCLEGSMQITVEGKSFSFEPGDKLIIHSNTPHAAIVGSKGCLYFWSEKII